MKVFVLAVLVGCAFQRGASPTDAVAGDPDGRADGPRDAMPRDAAPDAQLVCNVFAQTGCTGQACYPGINKPADQGYCAMAGSGSGGDVCTSNSSCRGGFMCVNHVPPPATCDQLCDATHACPALTCVNLAGQNYGICE